MTPEERAYREGQIYALTTVLSYPDYAHTDDIPRSYLKDILSKLIKHYTESAKPDNKRGEVE